MTRGSLSFLRAALAVTALSFAACAAPAEEAGEGADALAEVPQTGVRDQKETGNCWLFATLGWVESLEIGAAREAGEDTTVRHYSPTYLDYWDWYTKITEGEIPADATAQELKDALDSGGSWGAAVELVSKWGLVTSKDVDPNERDADKALAALEAVATSLREGNLRTAAARADRRVVRRELDRAFGFSTGLRDAMERTFGDGSKTLEDEGVTPSPGIRSAEDVEVRIPRADGSVVVRPLTDAIGERADGDDPDKRTGTYAFRVVTFTEAMARDPNATRAFLTRIQKVLHTKTSIPIGWYWADKADPSNVGRFEGVSRDPSGETDSTSHLSILDDYQAENVPGFGTLKAGVVATGAQQEAALARTAKVAFLRIKNSYGARTKTKVRPAGYDDLYASYLLGRHETCPEDVESGGAGCERHLGLEDVALPAGF